MIRAKQNGEVYEISFKYDPVLVSIIKNVPGKRWNPNSKIWTLPKDKLGWFLQDLKGTKYESQVLLDSQEHINENASLDSTTSIPDIDVSKIPFYVGEGLKPFNHQIDFMKYAIDRQQKGNMRGFILADEQGVGKALTLDTLIHTPYGDKPLSDIHPGDYVFDQKGNPTKVLREYYHDSLNMYKVTFSDDTYVTCCEDHLWKIYHSDKSYVASTSQIISGTFRSRRDNRYSYTSCSIPKCEPVNYRETELPIDPWLLGFLIGDGSLSSKESIGFTCYHPNIVAEVISTLPEGYKLSKINDVDYVIVKDNDENSLRTLGKRVMCIEDNLYFDSISSANRYYGHDVAHATRSESHLASRIGKHFIIVDEENQFNYVRVELDRLKLLGCKSRDKFIPSIYKYNSINNRIALLQGLMDSDGYADATNGHSYSTMSKQLADDVCWLVRSLGGLAYVNESQAKYRGKFYGPCYDVRIRLDDPTILYRSSEKKYRATARKFKPRKTFKRIEYVGKLPGKCISVDNPDHLYLCENFIVTHNTVETCNLAIYNKKQYGFKHCLVICCINTSKYNWYNDIKDHTRGKFVPYILGTRFKRDKVHTRSDTGTKEKLEDLRTGHMYGDKSQPKLPYFIIMNIEGLRAREGKQYPIVNEICRLISNGEINMIAIDEIHKNASPSSTQGKQLLKIKKETRNACEWIPITGTPIVNKPTDVFTPLKLINGHNFSSYYMWCKEFCIYGGYGDHEIVGYKNIPRLKVMLQSNMIRRLKKDVLDLPPKIYYTEYVENTDYQQRLYNKIANDIIDDKDNIVRALNPLTQFMRLRQVNGSPEIVDKDLKIDSSYISKNAKLKRLLEILEEIHERGEKVIVFSNWVEPLRTLYKFVSKKYKTCCYTGTMSPEDREKHKRIFQNNPEYTVMLGTIGAMGTSHTLTAANNVVFFDEPWTATDKAQAEDRVHRAGTTKSVNIITLLSKDTIDDRVHDIVYGKDCVAGYIVDGKLDIHNNPELFDKLLGDTIRRK